MRPVKTPKRSARTDLLHSRPSMEVKQWSPCSVFLQIGKIGNMAGDTYEGILAERCTANMWPSAPIPCIRKSEERGAAHLPAPKDKAAVEGQCGASNLCTLV